MTLDKARDIVQDASYFGTMMVHTGLADGMVSGAVHTTAHTIRPAFEIIKTQPGSRSSRACSSWCWPTGCWSTATARSSPIRTPSSSPTSRSPRPRTAAAVRRRARGWRCCRYSTGESGSGADVEKVRAATELVRERGPSCWWRGRSSTTRPRTRRSAARSCRARAVAGRATVFIFPDLNTGNNTYKAVQRSAGRGRDRAGAAGAAQAGQRPVARRAGAGHRQHRRDHGDPGPAATRQPSVTAEPA